MGGENKHFWRKVRSVVERALGVVRQTSDARQKHRLMPYGGGSITNTASDEVDYKNYY